MTDIQSCRFRHLLRRDFELENFITDCKIETSKSKDATEAQITIIYAEFEVEMLRFKRLIGNRLN